MNNSGQMMKKNDDILFNKRYKLYSHKRQAYETIKTSIDGNNSYGMVL